MKARTLATSLAALMLFGPAADAQPDHTGHHAVGTVRFANSCSSAVQDDLARGIAMVHSFWYSAGEQAFHNVLANDPTCAIADWGIASILMLNALNGVGSTPKGAEQAAAAIEDARHIGAGTQRERDYIEAVAAYYQDFAKHTERERQEARAAAYEALAAKYPDDDEATIFSALYIAGTQKQSDQTYAAYARAAAILQPLFVKYPDHPGVAHYLIHVYDAPPLAQQGLPAARRYAEIAPDAPHALHMPSHIFTRVGAWADSAATNRRAYAAALKGGEPGESYHASDYAVYADLQMARDAAAQADMANALKVTMPQSSNGAALYSSAAMPARYAVERGDWRGAMALPMPAAGAPYTEALTLFARGLGAARIGDPDAAGRSAAELEVRHKKLTEAGNTYWAAEVAVQQRTVAAWIALARKQTDDGLRIMREAADMEDRNEKHIVTPGRILPARELLGDMLLEAGKPADALAAYEASQQREPNRFRGTYGAARAAEAAGDKGKASAYYQKLLDLAKDADTQRPEIAQAKAFLRG